MSGDQLDLDAIEARAKAATEGPWDPLFNIVGGNGSGRGGWHIGYDDDGEYEGVPQWAIITRDAEFITHAREDVPALVAEVRRLWRWKDEALPVMDGLQELGGALGLPLGSRITGRQALDAAMDLHNEVRNLRAEVARREP